MIHMVDSAVSYYIAVYGSGVLFSIHEIEWVANVELQCLTPAVSGLQPLACEVCSGCRVSATSQVCCCNLQRMLRELWVVISYCCGYLDLWLRDLWVVLMSAVPWVCVKTWEQVNVVSVHTTKLREGKGRWLAHGWSYGWEQIYSTPFTLFSCNQPIVFFPCTKPVMSLPEVFFSHSKSIPATASRNDALWLGYRSLWLGYRLAELAQGRDDDSHQ